MKGFKWTGWVKPQNCGKSTVMTVFRGNFYLELNLPNALKITSFTKLKDRLDKYITSHNGKVPETINCTYRQLKQYVGLHLWPIDPDLVPCSFQGIPMVRYGTSLADKLGDK